MMFSGLSKIFQRFKSEEQIAAEKACADRQVEEFKAYFERLKNVMPTEKNGEKVVFELVKSNAWKDNASIHIINFELENTSFRRRLILKPNGAQEKGDITLEVWSGDGIREKWGNPTPYGSLYDASKHFADGLVKIANTDEQKWQILGAFGSKAQYPEVDLAVA